MSHHKIFTDTLKLITKFESERSDSDFLYDVSMHLWDCYAVLYNVSNVRDEGVAKFDIRDIKGAFAVIQAILPKYERPEYNGSTVIDFSFIPTHLINAIDSEKQHTSLDFPVLLMLIDSLLVSEEGVTEKISTLSTILEKSLLAILITVLNDIIDSDLCTLINKCVVYDHMGNRAHEDSEFTSILKMATERALIPTFNSTKKEEVYRYLAMLNYRLNNYSDAKDLFIHHIKCVIEKGIDTLNNSGRELLLDNLISLAYCYEKLNTFDGIMTAVCLLESIRESVSVQIFSDKLTIEKSWIEGNKYEVEIYHALAHFYNERAVFHHYKANATIKNYNKKDDIKKSREYISIAKNKIGDHSLHSCHGLICFEDNDFYRAAQIYIEAKGCVASNEALKNELLFYLAQANYRIAKSRNQKNQAKKLWEDFATYCRMKHNYDALAQYYVIRAKAELADITLQAENINYYKDFLKSILSHRVSKYVPKSIAHERTKIIYTLRVFIALHNIFNDKSSFVDGIEEISFHLTKYVEYLLKDRQTPISHVSLDEVSFDESKEESDNSCASHKLFVVEYSGLELVCYGNIADIENDNSGIKIVGRIPKKQEDVILNQIKSNRHIDVIIYLPSNNDCKCDCSFLKKALNTEQGICVVTYTDKGQETINNIKNAVKTALRKNSIIYQTDNSLEAIRIAFCFGVFELMRKHLISPVPMLGLAPLVESKSYSFQAGERFKQLIQPPERANAQNVQIRALSGAINKLSTIQHSTIKPNIEVTSHLDKLTRIIEKITPRGVLLAAYFANYSENIVVSQVTAPYKVYNNTLDSVIDYVCPGKNNEPYNLTSIYKSIDGYDVVDDKIESLSIKDSFCDFTKCSETFTREGCRACLITLDNKPLNLVRVLIENLFSVVKIKRSVQCICTYILDKPSDGIILIITDFNDSHEPELHRICKAIHSDYVNIADTDKPNDIEDTDHVEQTSIILGDTVKRAIEAKINEHMAEIVSLLPYWQDQKGSEGSVFSALPQSKIDELTDLQIAFNEFKDSWLLTPPVFISSKSDLLNVWNEDEHYKTLVIRLGACRKNTERS
ncbi:MAG: hypothetical protein FWE90_03030 [Defluviitaleaceae bacterium]|nr:hypothetical protein [Defluviitaleaceae bacterium]